MRKYTLYMAIALFVFWYLLYSFVCVSLNPADWRPADRGYMAVFYVASLVSSIFIKGILE